DRNADRFRDYIITACLLKRQGTLAIQKPYKATTYHAINRRGNSYYNCNSPGKGPILKIVPVLKSPGAISTLIDEDKGPSFNSTYMYI
ncbi:hypothetical protein Tsubulata_028311, partial [Turnera subulata]